MNKKSIYNEIFVMMNKFMEDNLSLQKAIQTIHCLLEKNILLVDNLPVSKKKDYIEIYNVIKDNLFLISDSKILIMKLLEDMYKEMDLLFKSQDESKSYLERERLNYQYILQSCKVRVILNYIHSDINLKKLYEDFKGDLKLFGPILGQIGKSADSKDIESLKINIKIRIAKSSILYEKYSDLLTQNDLVSVYEKELVKIKKVS